MVGSHLADYILANHPDVDVHGIVRWRSRDEFISHLMGNITLHHADLKDLNSLVFVLRTIRPDRIFHLAAQSYVMDSYTAPAETLATNIIGTTNLLDAIRMVGIDPLIHVCSSCEVYGQVNQDEVPIRESNTFRPASPYAVSKVGEDMIAYQYHVSYGLKTIRTRMFTHTGPRRGDVFAESAFAKQVAEIEAGVHPDNILKVGNLNSVRTFADVRDAVRAYWLLLEKCAPGEVYNIGGNRTMTTGEMLGALKGLATCEIKHEVDPRLVRPSDVTLQIPDMAKFQKATGWRPEIDFETMLRDLLNYHRARVRHAKA
jgi:GDPmannose 4,6-dehydratase/GDP-4-dehydro-6-deoxy-D-mannose reductase